MKTLLVNQTMDHEASTKAQEMRVKYVVVKVTNSIRPLLNDELTPAELDVFCKSDSWNVTIS